VGGFELEKILSELYPILQAVKPQELTTIIDTLATAGEGEGAAINRQIANFSTLAEVQARHDADFRLFLDDLAKLSDELGDRSSDLISLARDANIALPPINERSDELAAVLDQTSRLATDVADILDANQSFLAKAATEGGKPVQLLFDHRPEIPKLLDGLRMFFQVLAEVGHIDKEDGTKYAGVKFIIGEECPEGRVEGCGPNSGSTGVPFEETAAQSKTAAPGPGGTGVELPPIDIESPFITPLPDPPSGKGAVSRLVERLAL